MTAMQHYRIADEAIGIQELRLPVHLATPEIVAARQAAFAELEPMVRGQLLRVAPGLFPVVQPATVYDAVYPATPEIGGHWTIASVWIGPVTHTVSTYSVALAFDAEQRPDHFIVTGAREVRTDDASEASLAAALASARAFGPLHTSAPHIFQGFAL